jgi:hypothetical protein
LDTGANENREGTLRTTTGHAEVQDSSFPEPEDVLKLLFTSVHSGFGHIMLFRYFFKYFHGTTPLSTSTSIDIRTVENSFQKNLPPNKILVMSGPSLFERRPVNYF